MCQDSRTESISICKKYFSKGSYLEYPGGQPPGPPQFIKTRRGSPAFATAPAITAGPAHAREIQKLRLRIKISNAYAQKYNTVCHGPLEKLKIRMVSDILDIEEHYFRHGLLDIGVEEHYLSSWPAWFYTL